jgi:GNAT superfamily N-acetyltransferase
MTEVRLRPAVLADLPRMLEVEIQAATLFPSSVLPEAMGRSGSPHELRAAVAAGLAWVAEAEHNLVVGFLVAQVVGTSLHIVEMDVHPAHGRQGIGGLLLEHAIAQCQRLGLHETTLTTFTSVPWNEPFYARHGFRALTSTDKFGHLTRALAHEASRGLKDRTAMLRDVGCPPLEQ